MTAGLVTPTEAGQGPSVLNIAMSIGAKIRDAAEDAKEQREKAAEKGETPKKGSLFKSSLANQFNPIKSKKAKSNWAKQFDWNKETKSDQQVKPPTGEGGDSKGKLKEFIAGGFTAILKDTGLMVSKLDGVKMMTGENLSEVTRASSTLTVIKDSIDTQTELRRKALEEAKFARAERKLEKTSDVAGLSAPKDVEKKDGGGDGDGGGLLDNLAKVIGIADLLDNVMPGRKGKPGKNPLSRFNPFNRSPVTQGRGGKPQGFNPLRKPPSITTSGGSAAPKPGGFKMPGLPKGVRLGGPLTTLFAGLEFAGRKSEGQNNLQAGVGTAGSVGGGLAGAALGAKGGALAGAAIGALFGGVGAAPGALIGGALGGILGGIGGSMGGGKLADMATGADKPMSEGGIVPSAVPLARGGIVDNPTKTTLNPGDSVIPLNRNVGKQMLGDANQATPGETAVDTVGAMILGVSAGMLGKTESGTVGDQVKQDIRKASKEFGISNLTFTSSIGKAQFSKVDPEKSAKDFMKSLFENITIAGGGGAGGKKGGGGEDNPPGGTPESLKGDLEADIGKDASQMKEEIMQSGATGIVDPTQQPWCAAYVNSQLKRQGIQGSGSALADSFENWGAPVDKSNIRYGDVIVGDYGGGSRSHVMFAAGSPKDGAVEIIGGNQSGKVTRGSIALNKIDYVRRAGAQPPALPTAKKPGQQPAPTPTASQPQPPPNPTNKPQPLPTGTVRPMPIPKQGAKPAENGLAGILRWLTSSGGQNKDKNFVNAARSAAASGAMGKEAYLINNRRAQTDAAIQQMLGRSEGGTHSRQKANQENAKRARENAVKLKAQRASAQRSRLGVQKVDGKWVNMGVSDQAVGTNPWWQVWNKKGATAERKVRQEKLAVSLAERLNKQEAVKLKPKPSPARAPETGGGTRPAPSSSSPQAAVAVMPPASASKPPTASAVGSFGSAVPAGKTSAMVFADFLYPDLV